LAEELDKTFGLKAELIPLYDGQGTLDILIDDKVVYSSLQAGKYLEQDEIVTLFKQYLPPLKP